MPKLKSFLFVFFQFASLGYLLISGPVLSDTLLRILIQSGSIVLGLWAIFSMRQSRLNVLPDVRSGSSLILTGPYKYIRHPMYLAVILFATSLLLAHFTVLRAGVYLLLLVDLILKMQYEEIILMKEFSDYKAYRSKTKRLIPFVY